MVLKFINRQRLALEIARSTAFKGIPIIRANNNECTSFPETDDEDSEDDEKVDTPLPMTIDATKSKVTLEEVPIKEQPVVAADGDNNVLTESQCWELSEPILHVEPGSLGEPDLDNLSFFHQDTKEESCVDEESDIEQHFGLNDLNVLL
jgi:hypothetical protein